MSIYKQEKVVKNTLCTPYRNNSSKGVTNMNPIVLLEKMDEAKSKAIDSLSRYKFEMFGYWSSTLVKYNQLAWEMGVLDKKQPNPFKDFVDLAKGRIN